MLFSRDGSIMAPFAGKCWRKNLRRRYRGFASSRVCFSPQRFPVRFLCSLILGFPGHGDVGDPLPHPHASDDYLLDEGNSFCYPWVMVEINITVSSVYEVPVVHFSPSISAIVRFSALAPVSALGFSAMDSLLSLEAF